MNSIFRMNSILSFRASWIFCTFFYTILLYLLCLKCSFHPSILFLSHSLCYLSISIFLPIFAIFPGQSSWWRHPSYSLELAGGFAGAAAEQNGDASLKAVEVSSFWTLSSVLSIPSTLTLSLVWCHHVAQPLIKDE